MRLHSWEKFNVNVENIHSICKKYNIFDYTINYNGSIDVKEDIDLSYRKLTKIPIKFRKVSGEFNCSNNKLTSLEGCPEEVSGEFNCSNNKLTSLEGGPKKVGHFICNNNQLTTLRGCSVSIGGYFNCSDNILTSLEGGPKEVLTHFYCENNELTSLEGSPKKVKIFICNNNKLTSLRGGPEEVRGFYYRCQDNKLTDVEGFPEFWEGELRISGNPVYEIINLFPKEKWLKAIYLINEYRVIKDGFVNSPYLEEIFHELGLTPPQIKYIEGYEVI